MQSSILQPSGGLHDIIAVGPNELWAVGTYSAQPLPAMAKPLTMRYDGNDWRQVLPDPNGPAGAWLRGVTAAHACELWTVGSSADTSHVQHFAPGSPAQIAVNPTSLDVSVAPGAQTSTQILIENLTAPGGVTLDWAIADVIAHPASGYTWTDSDDATGPTFAWQDITTVGTQVVLFNDWSEWVDLPFPFWFYGQPKSRLQIGSNSYVTFWDYGRVEWNAPIPSSSQPNDFVAAFWDNLDPSRGSGTVHYYHDAVAEEFIVQYTNVESFYGGLPYTFEIILRPNGDIVFQYLSMQGNLDVATIGIENTDASDGLQIAFNAPYVHDSLAVLIPGLGDPDWLAETPTSGSLASQSGTNVSIGIDASALDVGVYNGSLVVTSNDPDESSAVIPVTLTVAAATDTETDIQLPRTFEFVGNRPNPFNPSTSIIFELPMAHRAHLDVLDVHGRSVRRLLQGRALEPGHHVIEWDGRDDAGRTLPSGIYFIRLLAGRESATQRAVLLK